MLNKFNYKFLVTILVLLCVKNGISQDSLYYSSAFNQSGPDLKTELYNKKKFPSFDYLDGGFGNTEEAREFEESLLKLA